MRFFRKKKKQEQKQKLHQNPEPQPQLSVDEELVIIDAIGSSGSEKGGSDPPSACNDVEKSSAYHRQHDGNEEEIVGKIPTFLLPIGVNDIKKKNLMIGAAILFLMFILLIVDETSSESKTLQETGNGGSFNPNFLYAWKTNVAFIGNINFVLNDIPRLTQYISGNKITQDSCLHQKGSLLNILKTGNGMMGRWATSPAVMANNGLYDYGACSVPQLLLGSDDSLIYRNQNGAFYDDGYNPCLNDEDYYYYEVGGKNGTKTWDYVVMTDQAKRMSFDYSNQQSLMALNYTYAPILKQGGGKPIIVQPHAFWSSNENMTGLTDVPTFTSMIYGGAQEYKSFLDSYLPSKQRSRIAPVGNAFLAVYDDYPDLYSSLFLSSGVQPSPIGSLLYSLTIYASIYKTMPPRSNVMMSDMSQLFTVSRKVYSEGSSTMPTQQQAKILYKIARRVTLKGYKSKSFVDSSS
ncbi:MAG: hypothetical protein SGBAC_006759 [Bacillariaceae sp.]